MLGVAVSPKAYRDLHVRLDHVNRLGGSVRRVVIGQGPWHRISKLCRLLCFAVATGRARTPLCPWSKVRVGTYMRVTSMTGRTYHVPCPPHGAQRLSPQARFKSVPRIGYYKDGKRHIAGGRDGRRHVIYQPWVFSRVATLCYYIFTSPLKALVYVEWAVEALA